MRKISLTIIFTILAMVSCSKTKSSNTTSNIGAESVNTSNSVNANAPLNTSLSNQNRVDESQSVANSDVLKQIEAQQKETADPRKVVRQNNNSNQSIKKPASPGQQTW